jgi:PPOX class probable F420-dependent enzyme
VPSTLNERQRRFLEAPRFGALATVEPDKAPHLTVMWYLLDGDEIMFNTARGRRKPENLARDGRVALLVADGYTFVRVTGRAVESATGEAAMNDIHRLAVRYDGEESAARQMARFRTMERVSYRMRIGRVYASADLR